MEVLRKMVKEFTFVFSVRSDAVAFSRRLSASSVKNALKSTPSGIARCCSLSVFVGEREVQAAVRVLNSGSYRSLTGVYEVIYDGLSIKTRRIR